ncbi:uncharacterized protein LOC119456585 [Dermacentor silvarum]|uniref:uncharacterized protein LOC119456585 n=1 Tax=Dermacentor silvarum TaxID=543639 RepID=UPI001896CC6F|nr:uncharacterized protein LOC119456585 [Dermacentor silvarum]
MGTLSQLVTVVWKELCLRTMLRQGWLSLSECLLGPLLCLVLLLTTGPPFVDRLRDVPLSGVQLLDWPCAVVEKQLVFRRVAYAPHAPYSMRLMEATFRDFSPVEGLVGFQDPQAVTEFTRTKANDSDAFDLIIVFDNLRRTDDKPPEDLRYTLRYNTSRLYLLDDRDDRRGYYPLRRDYVVPLVCLLGDSHLRLMARALGRPDPSYLWRTRSFNDNKGPRTVVHRDYSALAFELGLVWLLLNYAADTVRDKRVRHREFRRIMGQTSFVYWFEVLLRGLGPMLASCCGLLFVVTSVPDRFGFSYLQYTDPTVLLTLMYIYALHMLTFVTLVTTFFTSETLVVLATCFAVLVSFLPYLLFVEMTFPFRLLCCVLPNTALQLAMDIIVTFERDMTGMQWDQLNLMLSADVPSLASLLLVMLLAVSFNLALALAMDDLLPLSTNAGGPRIFRACTIDDALARLYFSSMDLKTGYRQIEVGNRGPEKTALMAPDDLFEFKVMPLGLCYVSATFERVVDTVLAGLKWQTCLVYLDDVVVFATNFDDHLRWLETVLEAIESSELTLKPEKFRFAYEERLFRGHVLKSVVRLDPQKAAGIAEFPRRVDEKAVRRFIGLCAFTGAL